LSCPHQDKTFLFPVSVAGEGHEWIIKKFISFSIDNLRERLIFKRDDVDTLISKLKGTNIPQNPRPANVASTPIASKGRNSYLRLIQTLSEFATDGLTGQPSVDAAGVIAALKAKNIKSPIGEKALSNYLAEAANLQK
jgi:hypothetical protein